MKAKSKKIVKKDSKDSIENPSEISYTGEVKITLQKNGKNLSSRVYHNTGCMPMFRFIANCLCGQYASTDVLRPKYIQLFHYVGSAEGNPVPEDGINWNNVEDVSSKIIYNGTPLPESVIVQETGEEKATASFSFMIPVAYIQDSGDKINILALFSQLNFSNTEHPSAYFPLTKIVNDEEVWDSLLNVVTARPNDYNIHIQWTITISNK